MTAVCQCGHSAGEHPDIGHWDRVPCSRCNCCQYVRVTANRAVNNRLVNNLIDERA